MDEEVLSLPADTLQILNEFLQQKAQREQEELDKIQSGAGKDAQFEEDWQLSQFWYSATTKQTLGQVVKQLLATTVEATNFSIALLSCPSLYGTVKEIHENVKIFEYDQRFAAYGADFIYYDFNEADTVDYLKAQEHSYDLIIADPPFLSEECISKIATIIKKLQKSTTQIIFCSGEVVAPWLKQYLSLDKCEFRPEHERNLGNEFVSYANFKLDDYIKR